MRKQQWTAPPQSATLSAKSTTALVVTIFVTIEYTQNYRRRCNVYVHGNHDINWFIYHVTSPLLSCEQLL